MTTNAVEDDANYRDSKQIDADHADLDLYRLASKLDGMAARLREPDFRRAADMLTGVRAIVRKHMHRLDQEKTHG